MNIRTMFADEYEQFQKLSRKHFPKFEPPDFHDGYFSRFVVEDQNEILIGGGIRKIAEVVLVTDITKDKTKLGRALVKTLGHCVNVSRYEDIDFLYAVCENPSYEKHLIQHGFERIKGNALSLWVKHGIEVAKDK